MSEKTEVDQEYDKDDDASQSSGNVPEHQYSREELISLSKTGQRPKCLDPVYDSEDGRWDPDRWYKAQFELPGEVSPVTLADGKDRRRATDLDRDVKRIPSLSEPPERLKEERDGIVLGPQRRSFGTGCHVQTTLLYTRQLTLPDRDRDEPRGEKEGLSRDRERPIRKIGSGRIQIDRENSRDYSGLRDRFDDRDPRDREQDRDRDFAWNRERDWDVRDTEWDRDRRFDRSDRFRRVGDFPDRDRRDRDFRERGFDRNSRRRNNYRGDEREPEWYTRGPSSQNDTIELRGFDQEGVGDVDEAGDGAVDRTKQNKRTTPLEDKSSKESSEETSEADVKLSQRSSPEEDQQVLHQEPPEMSSKPKEEERQATTPQQNSRASPSTHKLFDFEEILKASILTLDEEPIYQGSRFSRFFSGMNGNMQGSDTSSMEDLLVPHDLLEDSHTSSALPSPASMMGAGPPPLGQMQHGMHHFSDQQGPQINEHMFALQQNYMPIPSPAGDNTALNKSPILPCVTALFNRTSLGGPNTSSASSGNFNTQDAEAQLKAMLFGGHKESASSSGTASPASLPPNVQRKVKTVAELEADMHQNSPQKRNTSLSVTDGISSPSNSSDLTAFNKLLILMNAASEASQHVTHSAPQTSLAGFGLAPSHSEFNHAVLRNREEQIQLQLLQKAHHQPFHPQSGIPPQHPPPLHHPHQQIPAHNHQQHPQAMMNQQTHLSAAAFQQLQKSQQQQHPAMNQPQQIAGLLTKPPGTPGLPMGMPSPHNSAMKPRVHSGGPLVSSDPIYNVIQQNHPTIVMNPASPGPSMAAILASQQSVVASTARVPSPLMFSQQPPLHLSAPSPIHPGQLSPRSLTVGGSLTTSTINSPTDMRSPVLHRVLSPQELSAHAQAVMQSALIKKQLLDQNERYLKKQLERARSPSQQQTNILRSQSVASAAPPAKNMPMNTFTPTSVLRKMHSDKALDKEKQVMDGHGDDDMDFMRDFGDGQHDLIDSHSLDGISRKSEKQFLEDLCDISFLDPINTDSVAMTNQMRVGQTHILPGPLSQPMSVEEKMKLSALAENPGYLSQMLDKSAKMAAVETSRASQGRPIVKAQEPLSEERNLQQHLYALQQQHQPPPPIIHSGRPVTGGSPNMQLSFAGLQNMQTNMASKPISSGRAIVGGNSSQQQQQTQVPGVPAQNIDMLRMLDLQRLQQMPHSQGMVLPPPPMGTPISCLGPPPSAVPVSVRIPMTGGPAHSAASAALMHQQIARANSNAISSQHNQQLSHFLAVQQAQQQRRHMPPLPSHHMVMPSGSAHMSPRSQVTGPLSPAALNATIQRVASPHSSMKMNGPLPMTSAVNGGSGPKIDMNSGIQRWFSPDILKTQLPSMPPLPMKGNKVMTVDELEGN